MMQKLCKSLEQWRCARFMLFYLFIPHNCKSFYIYMNQIQIQYANKSIILSRVLLFAISYIVSLFLCAKEKTFSFIYHQKYYLNLVVCYLLKYILTFKTYCVSIPYTLYRFFFQFEILHTHICIYIDFYQYTFLFLPI